MGRERPGEAFNANPDTGRMGFRCEWEPRDERPLVIYPFPFWRDMFEAATYEAAVSLNPRREEEGPFAYIRRVSEIVTNEREAGAKSMPHVHQSRRERDAALLKLRFQVGAIPQADTSEASL